VNVKDLSKQLFLDSSSLTGHLDRMERTGLVARKDDPNDRRAVRIFLTDKGRRLKPQLEPIGKELKETLQKGQPEDKVAAFTAALRHISRRLA
jgi:DNA-binding MarR family transcriptional regulator